MSDAHRAIAAVLLLGAMALPASAQDPGFVPFDAFYAQLSNAPLSAQVAKPGNQVSAPAAFAAMRGYLLGFYAGMSVKHSYMRAGHPYDCVPVMQQPSVRRWA